MKTSHIVLAIGAVALGGGALYYFAMKKGTAPGYYPQSQGYPVSIPIGGARNVQVPTPSAKGSDPASIIGAATPLGIATLPYLRDAFSSLFGSDSEPAALEATSSYEGLDLTGSAEYF
jgi:hypothetical protein